MPCIITKVTNPKPSLDSKQSPRPLNRQLPGLREGDMTDSETNFTSI